jgi:RNA polymerase sigma-70 factor (sigma-E family)
LEDEVEELSAMEARTLGAEVAPDATAGKLGDLYLRSAPQAIRLAYFLTGDRDLAEDIVQEAFVRVAGRRLRGPDSFDAYLRRTVVNLHLSALRRRRTERSRLPRLRDPGSQPPYDPSARDELFRALRTIPMRQRAAIVLRFYEDLSEREAAQVLGCSTGALNQLVFRGMGALREQMRGEAR